MKFKLKKITTIKTFPYKGIVHDLTVEKNHSYNVENIIVHNSICSSRIQCATGLSQGSAIMDCASRKTTAKLIADGGIKNNGDILKAIALGADYAMLGKMLAGTSLAGGECYDKNKELVEPMAMSFKIHKDNNAIAIPNGEGPNPNMMYKSYHGMASKTAREGVLSYGSVEGVTGLIPYTGETKDVLNDMKLNLKAGMSYCGVRNWKEFQMKSKPIFVSNSGIIESQTHVL